MNNIFLLLFNVLFFYLGFQRSAFGHYLALPMIECFRITKNLLGMRIFYLFRNLYFIILFYSVNAAPKLAQFWRIPPLYRLNQWAEVNFAISNWTRRDEVESLEGISSASPAVLKTLTSTNSPSI